jgi:hypothetical protein
VTEKNDSDGLTIGEAFPAGNAAGEWVLILAMAMNDLVTLDGKIHDALDKEEPGASYFFRLLCGTLRELWRLFQVADEDRDVAELIDELVDQARADYDAVRELFVRPDATDGEPNPRSWAELHLKDVRDRTFHYPRVGDDDLHDALTTAADEEARFLNAGARPFEFADVVALQFSFGDINQPGERERYEEIVTTAKQIQERLISVVWNALGAHLRSVGLEPRRLEAAPEGPASAPADA